MINTMKIFLLLFILTFNAQAQTLREAVNPVGFARDINLDRIDQTVHITNNNQVGEFLQAVSVPWTRVIVDPGLTMAFSGMMSPAEGVKVYSPSGSFTIDTRTSTTNWVSLYISQPHVYMANFIFKVAQGGGSGNNPYGGIGIFGSGADLVYLQSFTIDSPAGNGGDAPETFQIWQGNGYPDRITLDQYEIILEPVPKSGSKCVLTGGGSSSTIRLTMVHGVCRGDQRGPLMDAGGYVDFFNNVVPFYDRWRAIRVRTGSQARVRASFFYGDNGGTFNSEVDAQDSASAITLGPEPNTTHPGAVLRDWNYVVPLPPYPNPPIWDEATVLARAGAGNVILPDDGTSPIVKPNPPSDLSSN